MWCFGTRKVTLFSFFQQLGTSYGNILCGRLFEEQKGHFIDLIKIQPPDFLPFSSKVSTSISVQYLVLTFKMVYKVLERISKSLHICAFDFSCLSTAFIIATLVSIVMRFLLLVVFADMVGMRWRLTEIESKNGDVDRHNERDKTD